MTRVGMEIVLAYPEGDDSMPEMPEIGQSRAAGSAGRFNAVDRLEEAFQAVDIVYPNNWAAFQILNQFERKTTQALSAIEDSNVF